jgi:hypothetical protein
VKNPIPHPVHAGHENYQVFDPEAGEVCPGIFVIGWSRKASDGLVGKAKQDGERGVIAVNHYLEEVPPGSADQLNEKLDKLRAFLNARQKRFVEYCDVQKLESIEKIESLARGVEFHKFTTDDEMLDAIKRS